VRVMASDLPIGAKATMACGCKVKVAKRRRTEVSFDAYVVEQCQAWTQRGNWTHYQASCVVYGPRNGTYIYENAEVEYDPLAYALERKFAVASR
jgi:hypothetical protein